jgi:deoxyadenosine/deoxycytidine kinase
VARDAHRAVRGARVPRAHPVPGGGRGLKQIAVIGPIASGKTTAAKGLAAALGARYVEADTFAQNPFLRRYAGDIPRWSFATELKFTYDRIRRSREIAVHLEREDVVVDSGLLMSVWVFARHHVAQGTMSADEWAFYEELTAELSSGLPAPDAVVLLRARPEVQAARIVRRGRAFESAYTPEYLRRITEACYELAERLRLEGHVVVEVETEREDLRTAEAVGRLAAAVRRGFDSIPA